MTLDTYLSDKAITEPAFAALVGIDQSTVNRVRRGAIPSAAVMRRICAATNGAVTPNDIFGIMPVTTRKGRAA